MELQFIWKDIDAFFFFKKKKKELTFSVFYQT